MLIAGPALLITDAKINEHFVSSKLIVDDDAARTVSNIGAHALAFRVATVFDLLTVAGVVILNFVTSQQRE